MVPLPFRIVALLLLTASTPASAALYAYFDANGAVRYKDVKEATERCRQLGALRIEPIRVESKELEGYIMAAATTHQIDPLLIKAVIKAESNYNPNAVSPKGAQGLMQLMPGTAQDLHVGNPFDPQQNINGGVKYLRSLLDAFGGNLELSLAAYNAGPSRVEAAGGIPSIPETVQYIDRVMRHYKGIKKVP
jgi:soluble lytic murein transglycosylase-like protein